MPERTALIVVDMQNDMCHPSGALGQLGLDLDPVVELIPRLAEFVNDARSLGFRPLFTLHENSPDTVSLTRRERHQARGTAGIGICEKGSWGAQIHEAFLVDEDDLVIRKQRYSAFHRTDLDRTLRSLDVRGVIVTGAHTNVCVESTVRDAFMLDYFVIVPRDGVASIDVELHQATLRNLESYFAMITSCEALLTTGSAPT
ncbi:MAG TPA: isochorismatase family cysteine hydrolase [bacterium]|nr:isochorismatase family cysteine hydrolase [bacterium]